MTHRNRSSRAAHPLTSLQRALLDFVAANEPCTAEQIREGLHAKHPLSDSSIRTLLRRLEGRGLLSHVVSGKVFLYRAETSSRSVAADAVRRLIQGFWSGSAEQFLTGLVDEKILSAAEIRRLAKKVKGHK